MRKGIAEAVGTVVGLTALLTASNSLALGPPSADLLGALAQVGVGLLVAYSVAIAGVERDLGMRGLRGRHENWLGVTAGSGICGLIGVGLALALAAHREAGHANIIDEAGLWWIISSIAILGMMVAALPIASYEWRRSR